MTEGWLSGCPCSWAHPSPPNGGAPLEGEPHSALAILLAVGASIARPQNLALPTNSPGEHCSPLQPTRKAQEKIEISHHSHRRVLAPGRGQCVRSWILKGALAKRSCAARTQAPLSRDCAVAKQSKPQWGFEAHERASSAGWRRSLCAAKRAPRK